MTVNWRRIISDGDFLMQGHPVRIRVYARTLMRLLLPNPLPALGRFLKRDSSRRFAIDVEHRIVRRPWRVELQYKICRNGQGGESLRNSIEFCCGGEEGLNPWVFH